MRAKPIVVRSLKNNRSASIFSMIHYLKITAKSLYQPRFLTMSNGRKSAAVRNTFVRRLVKTT